MLIFMHILQGYTTGGDLSRITKNKGHAYGMWKYDIHKSTSELFER